MSNAAGKPLPKFCARCGAFYNELKSATCPQCFSRLEVLDDATADQLAAEQEARRRDPDMIAIKQAEDERYKEQSFGGCLGLITILVLTVLLSVLIVAAAIHRQKDASKKITVTVRNGFIAGAPGNLTAGFAGAATVTYSPLAGGRDVVVLTGGSFSEPVAVYECAADVAPGVLVAFRNSVDAIANQSPGIHARRELIAGGLDEIVICHSDVDADRVAKALAARK